MGIGDFHQFYSDEWEAAFTLAAFLLQDTGAAEEIAQEAFIVLYKNWDDIDSPEVLLNKSLVAKSKSWHRTHGYRRAKLPLLAGPETVDLGAKELTDAIAKLPFRQRAVLVLRYHGGFTESQIAEYLGCKKGTVKSAANRAISKLRKDVQ